MIIFPAIDIKDGKCVRLTKGDFGTVEQVAEDPLETALGFKAAGAEWLHMVDLDGAREGRRLNQGLLAELSAKSGLKTQLGGGIRDMAALEACLAGGTTRAILGTAALQNPGFVKEAVAAYGGAVAVGIDALEGKARASGWLEDGGLDYIEFAKAMEALGVETIIFTDISKDGTLSGPNFAQLSALQGAVSCGIVASGGVAELEDVRKLAEMGLYGAICGKALYKGTLKLADALACGAAG